MHSKAIRAVPQMGVNSSCRQHSGTLDEDSSEPVGTVGHKRIMSRVVDVRVSVKLGRHCIEIQIQLIGQHNVLVGY